LDTHLLNSRREHGILVFILKHFFPVYISPDFKYVMDAAELYPISLSTGGKWLSVGSAC